MHVIAFIIFHGIGLLTLSYRVVVSHHACVHRLEFRKLRVIYFTSRTFWHWPIWRLWFGRLLNTLWLHFRLGYYTHFVPGLLGVFLGHTGLLLLLLYVIFHFLVTVRRLLNDKFASYYLLVARWVLICEHRLHLSVLFLWNSRGYLIIIRYYLVYIMNAIILLIIVIATFLLLIFFLNNNVTHFFHDLFHHFFVLGHLPLLLPILVLIDSLQQIPLLLLWLVYNL